MLEECNLKIGKKNEISSNLLTERCLYYHQFIGMFATAEIFLDPPKLPSSRVRGTRDLRSWCPLIDIELQFTHIPIQSVPYKLAVH